MQEKFLVVAVLVALRAYFPGEGLKRDVSALCKRTDLARTVCPLSKLVRACKRHLTPLIRGNSR